VTAGRPTASPQPDLVLIRAQGAHMGGAERLCCCMQEELKRQASAAARELAEVHEMYQ
jgi:hypothetical protein